MAETMSEPRTIQFKTMEELDSFLDYPKYVTMNIQKVRDGVVLTYYEILD